MLPALHTPQDYIRITPASVLLAGSAYADKVRDAHKLVS